MTLEPTITLGGLATFIAIIVGIAGLLNQMRKTRRENEADGRARTDELKEDFRSVTVSLGDRVTKLEARVTDFMPRTEIEGKIEHEKNNRIQADAALKDITDRLTRDVRDIMIGQGKIEQQQQGTQSDVTEIKVLVKDQGRDVNSRLDKLADCLNAISRKVEH